MKLIFGDNNEKNYGKDWVTCDWRGADINMYFNKNSKIPLQDNTVQIIYTSHVIEHMRDSVVNELFKEFYRILQPGGVVRIVAPDMEAYIKSYKTETKEKFYVEEYGVGSGRTWEQEVLYCAKKGWCDKKLAEIHNLLCLMMCSYVDKPNDGVLFNKAEVDKKLNELNTDDFIKWVCSHYDDNRPGGHCNGFYPNKVIRMLEELQFKNCENRKFRESNINEVLTNNNLDLELRKTISFYVEAQK